MSALEALLRERIAEQGSISFRDFMAEALYHPEYGYYTTLAGFGGEGDFITSPEIHPVFGALLARQVVDVWDTLGRPAAFRVLEYGGGSGALARTVIDALRAEVPALANGLAYAIEERSPSLRGRQQEALRGYPVTWDTAAVRANVVLANEVLDAAPVYRVRVRDGALRELQVGLDVAGDFVWVEAEDVPADVRRYFDRLGLRPPEGAIAEVNPDLDAWAERLARALDRGLALVLDYGYQARDLYSRLPGTLLTYYRHTLGSDPLVRVGRQDISTHVDFTTLATLAHQAGLDVLGLTTQRNLLGNLGLSQFARRLPAPVDRTALTTLVDPSGLGAVKGLFLGRALPRPPVGLVGGRPWPEPVYVPALPPEPPPAEFLDMWHDAFGGDGE